MAKIIEWSPAEPDLRTALGVDKDQSRIVFLDDWKRREGLYVIGKTGTGKTSFLLNLVLQDAAAGHGLCFLDPHGYAVDDIVARLPPERLQDVILLDASDRAFPFGINFYEVTDLEDDADAALRADQAVGVFAKLWGEGQGASWGPRLEDLLRVVSHTLIANPGFTMAEIPLLLGSGPNDKAFRARLVSNTNNPDVQRFWATYDALPPHTREERTESTLNKVRAFLLNPLVKNIVGQSHSTIDLQRVMDDGKILLVKLSAGTIGDSAVNLLGSILVGMVANAAFARVATQKNRPFFLYADEYQRFATPDFARLLTEARKFAIATTTAHQDRSQLHRLGSDVATIRAANITVFQVNGEDAQELALQFDCTPPPVEKHEYVKSGVVDHLLRDGHPHQTVMAFVEQYLRPLEASAKDPLIFLRTFSYVAAQGSKHEEQYTYYPALLLAGLRVLNGLLYEAMSNRAPVETFPEDLITSLANYLGFSGLCTSQSLGARGWDEARVRQLCRRVPIWDRVVTEVVAAAAEPYLRSEQHFRNKLTEAQQRSNVYDIASAKESLQRTQRALPVAKAEAEVRARREVDRARPFIEGLWAAMVILAQDPILTDSGQPKGIQQTFADRQNEIANSLTSLPPRTARCKIQEITGAPQEYTIEVLPLSVPLTAQPFEQRRERLKEQARAQGYCRPRPDVEDEIRRRQDGPDTGSEGGGKPAPPDSGAPSIGGEIEDD